MLRIIVAVFSLFFLKRKDAEGRRESGNAVRREEKKRGGRKEGKWKARRRRAHLLEGAERRFTARCACDGKRGGLHYEENVQRPQ